MNTVLVSPTGELFIIEPFGFMWTFEGLHGLGYWEDKKKMMQFYKKTFGLIYVGRL